MSKRKWETFRQGETVEDKPEEEVGLFTQEGSDSFAYWGGYTSQILLMKYLKTEIFRGNPRRKSIWTNFGKWVGTFKIQVESLGHKLIQKKTANCSVSKKKRDDEQSGLSMGRRGSFRTIKVTFSSIASSQLESFLTQVQFFYRGKHLRISIL